MNGQTLNDWLLRERRRMHDALLHEFINTSQTFHKSLDLWQQYWDEVRCLKSLDVVHTVPLGFTQAHIASHIVTQHKHKCGVDIFTPLLI